MRLPLNYPHIAVYNITTSYNYIENCRKNIDNDKK